MLSTVCLMLHPAGNGLNIHVEPCTSSTGGMKSGLTMTIATLHKEIIVHQQSFSWHLKQQL